MQISVFDRLVLSPLEIDSLPFHGTVRLLNTDAFLARQWFQKVDMSDERVLPSLKRLLTAGFITCHADGTVDGPPIPPPPLSLMKECWFTLTPSGGSILRNPGPWEYEIREWTFPLLGSGLAKLVDDLRGNPERWVHTAISASPSSAQGLRGWTNYVASLETGNRVTMSTHIFERFNMKMPELLQGHFRPILIGQDSSQGVIRRMEEVPLTNVDLMILDVLQDDIEPVPLIVEILSHEDALYKKWHFGQAFSSEEVSMSLTGLVERGYVVAYGEVEEPTVRLEPLESRSLFEVKGLWFGLTVAGREKASQPWPWEED